MYRALVQLHLIPCMGEASIHIQYVSKDDRFLAPFLLIQTSMVATSCPSICLCTRSARPHVRRTLSVSYFRPLSRSDSVCRLLAPQADRNSRSHCNLCKLGIPSIESLLLLVPSWNRYAVVLSGRRSRRWRNCSGRTRAIDGATCDDGVQLSEHAFAFLKESVHPLNVVMTLRKLHFQTSSIGSKIVD